MQRPRAYQISILLGYDWFTHQHAKSAVTPSMISGHCIEAMMGGIAAFYRAREIGTPSAALAALAQHTVDAGDRRVLAGVHYPSDNISSWLTGLLLCPHVCSNNDGASWMWQSITTKSMIYAEIKRAVEEDAGSPYHHSFDVLAYVGEQTVVDTKDESLRQAAVQEGLERAAKPGECDYYRRHPEAAEAARRAAAETKR